MMDYVFQLVLQTLEDKFLSTVIFVALLKENFVGNHMIFFSER